ncbi:CvpA family protein [Alloalcanivorax profundimaris]|uniref:Colicin V production protein n=1 Tax=Alloalcanivorax profundimaris TaxID=2735259 RepID=A0ABS0AW89_9GAMM|nr:CvpA family protein [Alloalcanivorax profundimaris]MAO60635.1 colicin V production CvpA [Alcanivorax sp.]MBM1144998.1 CvpA family protein [Alcanivorax sp. ZXX171]MCQ6261584.1 CvpA family protein [Alcanivorax sp. MM125-6]UWN52090.1 Colicin V production protein [Alcanivorax sp. ALC70]MBF1801530.1 CvpA family protein [Alloalcanivorax profundimaris]|tara:strand:- start:273 stop:767 length:495 start_codon:yes stop_codon:yes gene_type:complete
MNLADGIILFIIAVSALISVRRGFTREAFSLLTWVAAFIVARLFSPALTVLLADSIETPSVRLAVAFGGLFAVTLIVGALINHLLGELIRVTGLSGTDRLLGMVFGALRGALVVVVLVALGHHLFAQDTWWRQSMLVPHFAMLEDWTRRVAGDLIAYLMNVSGS